jgi:hypothetical protein
VSIPNLLTDSRRLASAKRPFSAFRLLALFCRTNGIGGFTRPCGRNPLSRYIEILGRSGALDATGKVGDVPASSHRAVGSWDTRKLSCNRGALRLKRYGGPLSLSATTLFWRGCRATLSEVSIGTFLPALKGAEEMVVILADASER